jgi:hypothetical protein
VNKVLGLTVLEVIHSTSMAKGESADAGEKYLLVERIAASSLFQKSPRLREFLLYVANCTLENRLAEAREQVIAERVFNRKIDSQGGQDSIVRAEARNLRKRLEVYFATEGKDDPIVVVMPKGGYSLAFETRLPELDPGTLTTVAVSENGNATAELLTPPQVALPVSEPIQISGRAARGYRNACVAMSLVAAVAVALAVYWRQIDSSLQNQLGIETPSLPFSAVFGDTPDSFIVTSDTGLLQIAYLAHRRITLDEYIARSYPNVPHIQPPDLIRNWNVYEFTDGREMAIAGLILRGNARYAQHISLRSGHDVQLEDFKSHNIVLIGSPISNPWAQLYEDKLNFQCDFDNAGQIVFHNKSPRQNELAHYPSADDVQRNRTYARIVFLPRSSDAGSTLLIAGTTAQSTQAAGEFLIDQSRLAQTLRSIGVDPAGPPRYFEILIRSNTFVGGAILPEVVAWRLKAAPEQ